MREGQPSSAFFARADGSVTDDPNAEDKAERALTLREALLVYFAGLRERVVQAALELA